MAAHQHRITLEYLGGKHAGPDLHQPLVFTADNHDDLFEIIVMVDLTGGMLKSVVFGVLIAIVSCYMGLKTRGGVAGVGRSTTTAVVISLILIFIANFFITRFYGLN